MSSYWSRLTREQQRVWTIVTGGILVGTVFKVTYFNYSRGLISQSMERRHAAAMEHLERCQAFAEWSLQDQERRLPKLTPEQEEQMKNYVQMFGLHHHYPGNDDDDVHMENFRENGPYPLTHDGTSPMYPAGRQPASTARFLKSANHTTSSMNTTPIE